MEIDRDLIAASSTPLALATLDDEESYGFAILERVREMTEGRREWPDGLFYPVLHRLERLGHLESRWEVTENGRRRKYYWITARGRTYRRAQHRGGLRREAGAGSARA